jgi:hypothetical protein
MDAKPQDGSPKRGGTRRGSKKLRALNPELNLKTRYEEIADLASYAHTLPPDAQEWLNSYSEEYICANFDHPGQRIHPVELVEKVQKNGKVRIIDRYAKECYDRNNARNRCIVTQEKAQNMLESWEDKTQEYYAEDEAGDIFNWFENGDVETLEDSEE